MRHSHFFILFFVTNTGDGEAGGCWIKHYFRLVVVHLLPFWVLLSRENSSTLVTQIWSKKENYLHRMVQVGRTGLPLTTKMYSLKEVRQETFIKPFRKKSHKVTCSLLSALI